MSLPNDTEAIVRSLARLYAMQGRKREVALLARSQALMEEVDYDNWDGGTTTYDLTLRAPADIYSALEHEISHLEAEFQERLSPLLRGYAHERLGSVVVSMELRHDENWRAKALGWLESSLPSSGAGATEDYDYFICHASDDKSTIVQPLAEGLAADGIRVWYDAFELSIGDGLRRSIDKGLANSRYGIVVLSNSFFAKNWAQYELDGLTSRQLMGQKVILPIWHGVDRDIVAKHSPPLADTLAYVSAQMEISEMVTAFVKFLRGSSPSESA